MGGTGSKRTPLEELELHRAQLHKKQQEYHDRCNNSRRRAQEQLAVNNKQGALIHLRQLKSDEAQAAKLANIVSNLDGQRVAIENTLLTRDTLTVMASCARDLGREMLSAEVVEAGVDRAEELEDESNELMSLLTAGRVDVPEDELLACLRPPAEGSTLEHAAADPSSDDRFLAWARVAAQEFPVVPTHPIDPPPSNSASMGVRASQAENAFAM
ncbi:MAG: Snf7 family protein [Gammaproteobacteria bacterium]